MTGYPHVRRPLIACFGEDVGGELVRTACVITADKALRASACDRLTTVKCFVKFQAIAWLWRVADLALCLPCTYYSDCMILVPDFGDCVTR